MTEKSYLKEGDGFVEITLAKPADVAGAKVSVLKMREPSVRDLEAAQSYTGSEASKEVQLFANLMEIGADDVRALTLRNYKRVQEAYAGFAD